jgi:hypothetical protein
LKDEIAKLEVKQRRSATVSRGPQYLEIAENQYTQVFQDESAPKALVLAPFIFEPNVKDEVAIWLSISVRFDYGNTERCFVLTSISITLIRGSQTKDYLLRAEWDSRSEDADHAQPHWHAIPGQAVTNNPIEERWSNIQSHMHLAICARWRANADLGELSHVHGLHVDDVISWVERTLNYAKSQVEHGLHKFPRRERLAQGFFK